MACEIVQSILSQKRQLAVYNVPPPRLEIVSPYEGGSAGFTEYQLSMRRKCEILQYESHKQSTQTNSLTKQQKLANIVRFGTKANRKSYICNNLNFPTPTNECNVPGPVIFLQKDPTVPLYMYGDANQKRSYSELPQINPRYRTFPAPTSSTLPPFISETNDVSQTNYVYEFPLGVLITNNKKDSTKDVFNIEMSVPIQFQVKCRLPSSVVVNTLGEVIQLKIQNIMVKFYYNDTLVYSIANPRTSFDIRITYPFPLKDLQTTGDGEYYGIQNMGIMYLDSISSTNVAPPSDTINTELSNVIYRITATINYIYNYSEIQNKFSYIKTGFK